MILAIAPAALWAGAALWCWTSFTLWRDLKSPLRLASILTVVLLLGLAAGKTGPWLVRIVGAVLAWCAALVAGFVTILSLLWRPRRPLEPGFDHVFVNHDGSVREATEDERKYIDSYRNVGGGDSGRPYVKSRYGSRTLYDRRLKKGFVLRRQVPRRIAIQPSP